METPTAQLDDLCANLLRKIIAHLVFAGGAQNLSLTCHRFRTLTLGVIKRRRSMARKLFPVLCVNNPEPEGLAPPKACCSVRWPLAWPTALA